MSEVFIITQEQFEEYQTLKRYYNFHSKLESVRKLEYLENDIDEPIKLIVAMFALLGCEPRFSCCGFDYEGQPIHKSHEYGVTYITLNDTLETEKICNLLVETGIAEKTTENEVIHDKWNIYKQPKRILIRNPFNYQYEKSKYPWSLSNSIHFSERATIGIQLLFNKMINFYYLFADEVIIKDTNSGYKKKIIEWVYPPLKDWVVTREWVLSEIYKKQNREGNGVN